MIQASTFDTHSHERETPWWIPKFSLSPSLRLYFLRVNLVSLVVLLVGLFLRMGRKSAGWAMAGSIVPAIVALGHHVGTAMGPRLFPIPVSVDLVWTGLETVYFAFMAIVMTATSADEVSQYGVKQFLELSTTAITLGVLALSLLGLLVLKILVVVKEKGSGPLRRRFDIARVGTTPWWEYPVCSFFGKVMTEQSVPGEMRWISILRGVLTILSIFTLVGFGVYQSIILPLSEVGTTQYREYRATSGLSGDQLVAFNGIVWSVVLVWIRDSSLTGPGDFFKSVTVEPRWLGIGLGAQPSECSVRNATLSKFDPEYMDVAVVSCPNVPAPAIPPQISPLALFPRYFITINFTNISGQIAADSPASLAQPYVSLFVGMTADIDVVVADTDPTTLFPGSNSLGLVGVASRKAFMVAKMAETVANPFASSPFDQNISTIGLTLQDTYGDWRIFQDSLGESVLTGLSTVGGLGALLSTLLAMFLGTSLMRIVIRAKPNSPFGYIHNLELVQRGMVKQCDKEYPALKDDVQQLEEKPGIIAYLFNTLIDVEPLGYGTLKTTPPERLQMTGLVQYSAVPRGEREGKVEGGVQP